VHSKKNEVVLDPLHHVEYNDLKMTYRVYGNGAKKVVCFHGHGKSAEDFEFLASPSRTIISINLFFHDGSSIPEKRIEHNPIEASELIVIIEKILSKENCAEDRIHLVAYSQGGRFGIALLPFLIDRLASIHFIAIDGLNDNNIYSMTQRQLLARKLFKYWTKNPRSLVFIAQLLVKINLLHPKVFELLEFYTSDPQKFIISYKAWAAFRHLRTDEVKIKQLLEKYPHRFKLIVGKYDKIITRKSAQAFLVRIDQTDALVEIPWGHDVFKPKAKQYIWNELVFK